MVPTTPTADLELKKGEVVTDYFDEMDEDMRNEFKDDAPIGEVIIKTDNK